MKICSKCKIELDFSNFNKNGLRNNKVRYHSKCKKCTSVRQDKEKLNDGLKRCTKCKEVKELNCFVYASHKKDKKLPSCKCCNKLYREQNKDRIRKAGKKYELNNKEKIKERHKKYPKRKSKPRNDEQRRIRREWTKNKLKNDPQFKLKETLSARIRSALKAAGLRKSKKSKELVGCEIDFLKNHLESLFLPGMSWENHGVNGWHIDHIKPCCSFDLSDLDQQKICFHWSNLQPLWAFDNMSKGGKWELSVN